MSASASHPLLFYHVLVFTRIDCSAQETPEVLMEKVQLCLLYQKYASVGILVRRPFLSSLCAHISVLGEVLSLPDLSLWIRHPDLCHPDLFLLCAHSLGVSLGFSVSCRFLSIYGAA